MSEITLHGAEAEKVWATFFESLLPFGSEIARISKTGEVVMILLKTTEEFKSRSNSAFGIQESVKAGLIREFVKTGDFVSSNFLQGNRPGRVMAFYQEGSFLLNLDLTKDPTKRESYSVEPGSLDSHGGRYSDTMQVVGRTVDRGLVLEDLTNDLENKAAWNAAGGPETKIKKMFRGITINEVDKIEGHIGTVSRDFYSLFKMWSPTAKTFDTSGVERLSKNGRQASAEELSKVIYEEFVSRDLDRWITDHEKMRATDGNPAQALASLMAAHMFGTFDGKFGLPSGRWLYPEDIEKSIKEMILPPLSTPNNIEVAMMSLARFAAYTESDRVEDIRVWLKNFGMSRLNYFEENQFVALLEMIGFGAHWREMAFARLELGHKLAAALMFTDAPDSVESPWTAWSLLLPDGVFGEIDIRRVWCLGDKPAVLLIKIGDHIGTLGLHIFRPGNNSKFWMDPGPYNPDRGEERPKTRVAFEAMGKEYEERFLRTLPLLENLVRGACLALSNPSDWRKGDYYGKPSGSEIKKASKHKELPVGERYVLGHPVQIDLREEVLDHVHTGKVGGKSPTKLFLVRGHHRRQAHGPGNLLRKTIWIEPHWRGPEDARVLLRAYNVSK